MMGKNLTRQATPCAADERSFSVSSGLGTTSVIGVTTSLVTVAPREYEGKMGLAVALPNEKSTKPPRQSAARMAQPGLIRAPSIRSFLSKGKLGVRSHAPGRHLDQSRIISGPLLISCAACAREPLFLRPDAPECCR